MAMRTEVFDEARRASTSMAGSASALRSFKTSSATSRSNASAVYAERSDTGLATQSAARRGRQPARGRKDQGEELDED
eukprot:2605483-Pyramimonas_sp.AAC.1